MDRNERAILRKVVALLCVLTLCTLPLLTLADSVRVLEKKGAPTAGAVEPTAAPEATQPSEARTTPDVPVAEGDDLLVLGVKPGEALTARLFQAISNNRRVEGSLQFELGMQAPIPAEFVTAVSETLKVAKLSGSFAQDEMGGELGFRLDIADQAAVEGKLLLDADGITLVTSLMPQKAFHISYGEIEELLKELPIADLFSEETMQVLNNSAPKYFDVIGSWMMSAFNNEETTENAVPATDVRDAAAKQETIRITGKQYKDLYVSLIDTFAADAELQQLLIKMGGTTQEEMDKAIAEAKKVFGELEPTEDGALVMTASLDDVGNLVGFDGAMGTLFKDMEMSSNIRYDYSSKEPGKAHAFQYDVNIGEDKTEFALRYAYDDSQDRVRTQETSVRWNFGGVNAVNVSAVEQSKYEIHGATETVNGERVVTVGRENVLAELLKDENLSAETRALLKDAKIGQSEMRMPYRGSVTTLVGDDFIAKYEAQSVVDGDELAKVFYTLSSGEYKRADLTGKTIIEVVKLTPEEWATLAQEAQVGAQQAMMAAMSRLPASALKLIMEQ